MFKKTSLSLGGLSHGLWRVHILQSYSQCLLISRAVIFRYCAWCASGHPDEEDYISAKEPLKIVYNKLSQASGPPAWGLGFRRQFHRGPFLRACGEGGWQEMVTLRHFRITDSLIPQYPTNGAVCSPSLRCVKVRREQTPFILPNPCVAFNDFTLLWVFMRGQGDWMTSYHLGCIDTHLYKWNCFSSKKIINFPWLQVLTSDVSGTWTVWGSMWQLCMFPNVAESS